MARATGASGRRVATAAAVATSRCSWWCARASEAAAAGSPSYADGFRLESDHHLHAGCSRRRPCTWRSTSRSRTSDRTRSWERAIRRYYLPDYSVPVLSEAVGLRAVKSDGTQPPGVGGGVREPAVLLRRHRPPAGPLLPGLADLPPHATTCPAATPLRGVHPPQRRLRHLSDAGDRGPRPRDAWRSSCRTASRWSWSVMTCASPSATGARCSPPPHRGSGRLERAGVGRDDDKLIERVVDVGDQRGQRPRLAGRSRRGPTSRPPRWRTACRCSRTSPASSGRPPPRSTSSRPPAPTSTGTPGWYLRDRRPDRDR